MERKEVVFVLGGPGSGKGTHVSFRKSYQRVGVCFVD